MAYKMTENTGDLRLTAYGRWLRLPHNERRNMHPLNQTIRDTIRRTLWSAYSDLAHTEISTVADAAIEAADQMAKEIRRHNATNDKPNADRKVREALDWLDKGAPGRAREVLMEALKQ